MKYIQGDHAISFQRSSRKRQVSGESEEGKGRIIRSKLHIHDNIFSASANI